MPRVIDFTGLIDDSWLILGDGDPTKTHSKIIVSFDRLKKEWKQLKTLQSTLGVQLEPTSDVNDLQSFLEHLEIVLLPFKVFSDGRAFSQAKLLRERFGFNGDIRAIGDVIPDQLLFMKRCGFNQFELSDETDLQLAVQSFSEITLGYQAPLRSSVAD